VYVYKLTKDQHNYLFLSESKLKGSLRSSLFTSYDPIRQNVALVFIFNSWYLISNHFIFIYFSNKLCLYIIRFKGTMILRKKYFSNITSEQLWTEREDNLYFVQIWLRDQFHFCLKIESGDDSCSFIIDERSLAISLLQICSQ
jgi:hypothetical protein